MNFYDIGCFRCIEALHVAVIRVYK